jgi:hypothetical protein
MHEDSSVKVLPVELTTTGSPDYKVAFRMVAKPISVLQYCALRGFDCVNDGMFSNVYTHLGLHMEAPPNRHDKMKHLMTIFADAWSWPQVLLAAKLHEVDASRDKERAAKDEQRAARRPREQTCTGMTTKRKVHLGMTNNWELMFRCLCNLGGSSLASAALPLTCHKNHFPGPTICAQSRPELMETLGRVRIQKSSYLVKGSLF